MAPYLQFKAVSKRYGAVDALKNVEFSLENGSVLALLGPNGAGKSTLFGCLLGLTTPTAGATLLNGRPIAESDRLGFGYLSERVALYPQRTVWENATFFAQLKGFSRFEVERQLKRVGLYSVHQRKTRQLSKGMLQRLGLAIALCGEPELFVLDEPFNGLDPALLEALQRILLEENKRGATLLISTHTMSAVEPLATHLAILLEGQLAASGPIPQFRQQNNGETALEQIYHRIARDKRVSPEEVALA